MGFYYIHSCKYTPLKSKERGEASKHQMKALVYANQPQKLVLCMLRHTVPRPRKGRPFSGEDNFQAKLKKDMQEAILGLMFVTSALLFVTPV